MSQALFWEQNPMVSSRTYGSTLMGLKSLVMEADTKQINTHMQNVKAE